jgi:hypothetical protein
MMRAEKERLRVAEREKRLAHLQGLKDQAAVRRKEELDRRRAEREQSKSEDRERKRIARETARQQMLDVARAVSVCDGCRVVTMWSCTRTDAPPPCFCSFVPDRLRLRGHHCWRTQPLLRSMGPPLFQHHNRLTSTLSRHRQSEQGKAEQTHSKSSPQSLFLTWWPSPSSVFRYRITAAVTFQRSTCAISARPMLAGESPEPLRFFDF